MEASPTTRLEVVKTSASASAILFIGYYSVLVNQKTTAVVSIAAAGQLNRCNLVPLSISPLQPYFKPLDQPSRYKGLHGGRGSGKSWHAATMLVLRCLKKPGIRVVCAHEIQKTLAESAKRLIEDRIGSLRRCRADRRRASCWPSHRFDASYKCRERYQ
jgi:hypothetical protein